MADFDDLKYIHERDAQDALGIAEKQWQQYTHRFLFKHQFPRPINDIVVAGMGGSGLAAKAFRSWPGVNVPFEVIQGYELPDYVNEHTLLVCSSYSGNTEETLSVLSEALEAKRSPKTVPMVVVVASGGKLLQIAKKRKLPFVQLPGGYQPRMTFGYQLRALVEIIESSPLLGGAVKQLDKASGFIQTAVTDWRPDVPVRKNLAKQLALELMGRSPVIYSGPLLFPAAYKWKINFNENAKNVAWCNQYPEFNHNEFLGWTSHPPLKPYAVVELHSSFDHPRIQKRFAITERLLSGKRPAAEVVTVAGKTALEQLLWAVALGDFVSLYLALLNGLNPTPVDLIEKLKTSLG